MLVGFLVARGVMISVFDNVYHFATPIDRPEFARNLWLPAPLRLLILNMNLHRIHHGVRRCRGGSCRHSSAPSATDTMRGCCAPPWRSSRDRLRSRNCRGSTSWRDAAPRDIRIRAPSPRIGSRSAAAPPPLLTPSRRPHARYHRRSFGPVVSFSSIDDNGLVRSPLAEGVPMACQRSLRSRPGIRSIGSRIRRSAHLPNIGRRNAVAAVRRCAATSIRRNWAPICHTCTWSTSCRPAPRFKFRLVGTDSKRSAGFDFTGRFADEALPPDYYCEMQQEMNDVLQIRVALQDLGPSMAGPAACALSPPDDASVIGPESVNMLLGVGYMMEAQEMPSGVSEPGPILQSRILVNR